MLCDKSLSSLPATSFEIEVEVTMFPQLLHSTHGLSRHYMDTAKFYSVYLPRRGFHCRACAMARLAEGCCT